MRLFCLFGILVSYECLECNNFQNLYAMQVNMNESTIKPETLRKQFMLEAFKHTAEYDAAISKWMEDNV